MKWENHIVDFQKATGEVFSDRLKCAIVLSRSPAPIRTYLRVQNRGDYGALRLALMNYLEAEDDDHGPVPMEVGAMKGKKGDRGKKGDGKGKFHKSLGKYDKSNEHSRNNDYGKGSEKRKRKKEERQRKRTRKRRETNVKLVKASECWQGYVQAVEEVRVLLRVQWHRVQQPHLRPRRQQRKLKNSMRAGSRMDLRRDWVDQWH